MVDVLTASEGGILDGLREQRDAVEELVDDVVQGYHNGFNRAIHNYSQVGGGAWFEMGFAYVFIWTKRW